MKQRSAKLFAWFEDGLVEWNLVVAASGKECFAFSAGDSA
jgi:hypothetical protein